MKQPRRGHDAQGLVKRANIEASNEGYSNFMALMRMTRISRQVEMIPGNMRKIYTNEMLRLAIDTYLTAEWDEFVPFPNTWKIRFDGFGKSDYSKDINGIREPFGILRQPKIDADALSAPPFYQPRGTSHFGGSFADVACVCNVPGKACQCKSTGDAAAKEAGNDGAKDHGKILMQADHVRSISTGCGIGN